jgi:hypothetical protein
MGTEFAWATTDRKDLLLDLLSYRGMSRDARVRMIEAKKAKAAKAAAKKAKAAKEAAEAKKAEGGEAPKGDAKAETPEPKKDAAGDQNGDQDDGGAS